MKSNVVITTLFSLLLLTSCQNHTQHTALLPTWDTFIEMHIEKAFSISLERQEQSNQNYTEALSEQELQQVKNLARNYYEQNFAYDLLSLKTAANDCHWYKQYAQYPAGNILILQAETTHAGEGVYRYIVFVKDNQQWIQIGEGY